jgi:hypothetical protein
MSSSLKSLIRSVVIGSNFVFSVTLTIWMLALSSNKDRVGPQIFHTSMSQQTHNAALENTVRVMSNATETGVADIPYIMVSTSNDRFFTIAAVHPQFLFFTYLIVSSCFALSTFTFPWGDIQFFSMARVMLVHVWNLLGLIAVIVVYSTYTHWGHVPLSNFFYSVAFVGLTWLYSYWHMVDSTDSWLKLNNGGKLKYTSVAEGPTYVPERSQEGTDAAQEIFDLEESHTVRRNIVQEMSLTVPLLFASTLLQGNSGMDQWRLQTVMFASWAFFAFYGVFYRFKETYDRRRVEKSTVNYENERLAATNALSFISLGIIVIYVQVILALGTRILFSSQRFPYFTDSLNTMKVGQFLLLLTMTLLLADVGRAILTTQMNGNDNLPVIYRFGGNMTVIVIGSILVKLFYFISLSNSDSWTVVS